jgi:hypothetical protein
LHRDEAASGEAGLTCYDALSWGEGRPRRGQRIGATVRRRHRWAFDLAHARSSSRYCKKITCDREPTEPRQTQMKCPAQCEHRRVYHEEGFGYGNRNRHAFRRPIIGGYARFRFRRLRAEPASQQCNGPVHLGRPKSGLVLATYGPSGRSCAQWQFGLCQVSHLRSAKGPQRIPCGPNLSLRVVRRAVVDHFLRRHMNRRRQHR